MLVEQFKINDKTYESLLGDISKISMVLRKTDDGSRIELPNKRILWQRKDVGKVVIIKIEYLIIESSMDTSEFDVESITLESSDGKNWTKKYEDSEFRISFDRGLLSVSREFKSSVQIR